MAKENDKWMVILDGKQGPKCDRVTLPLFSPDSKHLAYMAKENDKWMVILDGKQGPRYDGVSLLTFSPDSKHLAYTAEEGGSWFVVVDGKQVKPRFAGFVKGSSLIFDSPGKLHALAYRIPGPEFIRLEIEIKG